MVFDLCNGNTLLAKEGEICDRVLAAGGVSCCLSCSCWRLVVIMMKAVDTKETKDTTKEAVGGEYIIVNTPPCLSTEGNFEISFAPQFVPTWI